MQSLTQKAKMTSTLTRSMTSAISLAEPSATDIQQNQKLEEYLKSLDVFETDGQLHHRMEVLRKINKLVEMWVKDVGLSKNIPMDVIENAGGKIFIFGSYRLGIHAKGADLDALCLAPLHVERADFFTSFYRLLEEQEEVSELRAVEQAFVPVIKLSFDGIEIDMLFAQLALSQIPTNLDLSDVSLLRNLDIKSVRSINGCRVTNEIISLVPNVENFRLALRVIKLWAKKQGIYSNALGYLGGVSWAILVARICQLYPNANAATLVNKFFFVYSHWEWPKPILLTAIQDCSLGFPVWNPQTHLADRYHLMPIITPSYPQQNSTYNVSNSSRAVMVEEIKRGLLATENIMLGNAPWSNLFEPVNFFGKYNHYIVLITESSSKKDHVEYCGLVDSKIRTLISELERDKYIDLAQVNPESFLPLKSTPGCFSSQRFIGLQFAKVEKLNVDLTVHIKHFYETVYEAAAVKSKMLKDGMKVEVKYAKRKQLSCYLPKIFLKQMKKQPSLSSQMSSSKQSGNRSTSPSSSEDLYLSKSEGLSSPSRSTDSGSISPNQTTIKRAGDAADVVPSKRPKTSAFNWSMVMPTRSTPQMMERRVPFSRKSY